MSSHKSDCRICNNQRTGQMPYGVCLICIDAWENRSGFKDGYMRYLDRLLTIFGATWARVSNEEVLPMARDVRIHPWAAYQQKAKRVLALHGLEVK